MGRRDEDDEYEIADFGVRMSKQAMSGMATLDLPSGLGLFRPKKNGSMMLDFLPFKVTEAHNRFRPDLRNTLPGALYPERTYYAHRQVGVNGDMHVCLAATFGERCPACEDVVVLKRSPHADAAARAKELKQKQRQLWLVHDTEDPDRGVQLWEEADWNFGRHMIRYINGAPKREQAAYKAFFHPTRGFTVRVTPVEVSIGGGGGGKGGNNTEFHVHAFYPRERPLPKHLVDHGYDLDAMVRHLSYEQMYEIYHAGAATARKDEREADRPDDRYPTRTADRRDEDRYPTRSGGNGDTHGAPTYNRLTEREDPPRRESRDEGDRPRGRARDEEKPIDRPKGMKCATGDTVEYEYDGRTETGRVTGVDEQRRLVFVAVPGRERPRSMAEEDVTVVDADTTFDRKPADENSDRGRDAARAAVKAAEDEDRPRSKADARNTKWDDDGDDPRSAAPAGKGKAAKEKPPADDPPPEDNDRPRTRRRSRDD